MTPEQIGQLGIGGVLGFAAGFALAKIGKLALLGVGLGFILIQMLAYFGYLTVNWQQVEEQVSPLLEPERLEGFWQRVVMVLSNSLPFAGGIAAGMLLGLRAAR